MGSRPFDALPNALAGIGRDEDDGNLVLSGRKETLQLHAIEPGHLDIRDEARRVVDLAGSEILLGRGKCHGPVAKRSDQIFGGLTDRFVVVDDGDLRNLLHPLPQTAREPWAESASTSARKVEAHDSWWNYTWV